MVDTYIWTPSAAIAVRDAIPTILYSPTVPEVLVIVLIVGEVAPGIENNVKHLHHILILTKSMRQLKD